MDFEEPETSADHIIRPYFGGISPYMALSKGLTYGGGTSNKSGPEMAMLQSACLEGARLHLCELERSRCFIGKSTINGSFSIANC